MTLYEKAKELGYADAPFVERSCLGCPHHYEELNAVQDKKICSTYNACTECWAREYVEPAAKDTDVPTMRHFETGAVRDSAVGKGRYDLLPWAAIHALAQHCERGAIHYGARNVDKGIPQSSLIDSAVRQVSLYIQGDSEPYHLVAALWNIAWACEQEAKRQHLVDLPERGEDAGAAI